MIDSKKNPSKKTSNEKKVYPFLGHYKDQHEEKLNDELLWDLLRQGSQEALAKIFLKYNPVLFNYGKTLDSDKAILEDCIQELFLQIWKTREHLQPVNSVKYYLLVSYRRMVLKFLKQSDNYNKILNNIIIEYPKFEASSELNLLKEISKKEFFQRVNLAVENLPLRQKEALKLRYIEEKKYIEIQGIMGISVSGARKYVYKAIKNLRKSLVLQALTS